MTQDVLVSHPLIDGETAPAGRARSGSAAEPSATSASGRDGFGHGLRFSWQAQGLARVALLRAVWAQVAQPAHEISTAASTRPDATTAFQALLASAEEACTTQPSLKQRLSGVAVERTWTHLHTAEAILVACAAPEALPALLPKATDLTAKAMPGESVQRTIVGAVQQAASATPTTPATPLMIALAVDWAHGRADAAHSRVRSFRNAVLAAAVLAALAALSLVALGALAPAYLPMCTPDGASCVTGGQSGRLDVAVVALVGASAGVLSGLAALRRLRGTSTPYPVPLALAALKVPTGALTAVLGILVLQAGLTSTVFAAESPVSLMGWAIVLGLAQELLTRLADRQGELVLASVHIDRSTN